MPDRSPSRRQTYFNESAETARAAVKGVLDQYGQLLEALGEADRGKLQRSMGLKMEQLKVRSAGWLAGGARRAPSLHPCCTLLSMFCVGRRRRGVPTPLPQAPRLPSTPPPSALFPPRLRWHSWTRCTRSRAAGSRKAEGCMPS